MKDMNQNSDYDGRPSSEQLSDLHIYVVPPDLWRDSHNSAANSIINNVVSVGFIRAYPEGSVYSIREEIENQLGFESIPRDYVFLKSVGRNLTRLKAKQEFQLKVKTFLPPISYAPEIFLLEASVAAARSTMPPSGASSERSGSRPINGYGSDKSEFSPHRTIPPIGSSLSNYSNTVATQTDELDLHGYPSSHTPHHQPSYRKPAGPHKTHKGPYNRDKQTSTGGSVEHSSLRGSHDPSFSSPWRQSYDGGTDPRLTSRDQPERRKPRSRERADSRSLRPHDPRSLKSHDKSTSPFNTQRRRGSITEDGHLREQNPNTQTSRSRDGPHHRRYGEEAERRRHEEEEAERRRRQEEDAQRRRREEEEAERRRQQEEEAERRRRQEEEDERRRREEEEDTARRQQQEQEEEELSANDGGRKRMEDEERKRRQMEEEWRGREEERLGWEEEGRGQEDEERRQQEEERRRREEEERRRREEEERRRREEEERRRREEEEEEERRRLAEQAPPTPPMDRETEKERLLADLDSARKERKEIERKREELVKKAKIMQSKMQSRRNQARDMWKKKYFEEKKKTPPLEDECNKLRADLEALHRKIMSSLEGNKDKENFRRGANEKPSQQNNLKIQATRLQHDIEDLQRRVENVKMKLTSEMKLRNQAETELRALRAELTQKKINVTLTRQSQGLGPTQYGMAMAATPR